MNKKNYAGIPDKYSRIDDAKVVLIPVPYDGTSTWQKGSDKGPEAFLEASENMELYDIETRSEVYKKGIYLAPPVTENSSPEKMVAVFAKSTKGQEAQVLGQICRVTARLQLRKRAIIQNSQHLEIKANLSCRPPLQMSHRREQQG